MSRQGLDATSTVVGCDLNSGRRRRKETISRPRRLAASLAGSFTAVVIVLACVGVAASQAEPMPNGVSGTWQLKLNEEFTSSGLNTSLWTPGWQTNGVSSMSDQCVKPSLVNQPGDGYLHLWLRKEASTCEGEHSKEEKHEYTGSLVESNPEDGVPGHSGFHYSYGYVEWEAYITGIEEKCSSACIPDWPALWILPGNHETETDIMEGLSGVAEYHFHPPFPGGIGGSVSGNFHGWHTYGVDWEPGVVTYYYDGRQVGQETSEKINSTPQYLVMDMTPPKASRGHLVAPDEMDINYVRVWQHPPPPIPPEATTSAASEMRQTQATLNGTVNPKGTDTHYYFQYGKTTEYGSSTSSSDAGSGTSSVPVSAAVTGLEPGVTYHYRIVATDGGGTDEGKDETFETPPMPKASIVEWNGTQHVYYRGFNGQLREWSWNGSKWSQHGWGYENELAGEPSAVLHSNGSIYVYYRNTKGQIGQWWYGPNWLSEWNQHNWGNENEVAGNPSAIVLPNGTSDVYYRNTKGQMASWWYGVNPNSEWNQHNWGYENEVIGTPSAVAHSNNNIYVYYRNKAGQLGEWWYGVNQYSEWNQHNWGYEKEVASDPSAITLPNGSSDVYYRSSSGQVGQWWYGADQYSEWNQHNWGYEKEVAGTPSAVAHSNNTINVYYRATNAQLGQWWYGANQSSEWNQHNWGYAGALGGDPSASAIASGGEDIYYGGTNSEMWQWWIDGSSWNLAAVGSW